MLPQAAGVRTQRISCGNPVVAMMALSEREIAGGRVHDHRREAGK
jgi:hypothetical protein